jgi:hypothetical protein
MFSRGVWTSSATIGRIRAELEAERSTERHAKKQEAAARRREKTQAEYVEDFHGAVAAFLAFHPVHSDLAGRLARAVADHATPVGSGTVARTKRIPVEKRAEAAVIAWMRHQTTGYDEMSIPRVKGERREVRRMLARRSQELLRRYRRGEPIGDDCPLGRVLAGDERGHSMAKKKPKPKSSFLGRWTIVSMSGWDQDYVNEEVQAYIEFEPSRRGGFHFGYVRGGIDYRDVLRDGKPAVEFSWDGNDEMDPAQGRGWAVLDGDRLKGMIFFHQGDESDFMAERDTDEED